MNKNVQPISDVTKYLDLQRLINKIFGKKIEIDVAVHEYEKLLTELSKFYPPKKSFFKRLFKL